MSDNQPLANSQTSADDHVSTNSPNISYEDLLEQEKAANLVKIILLGLNFLSSIIVILLLTTLVNKVSHFMFYCFGRNGF